MSGLPTNPPPSPPTQRVDNQLTHPQGQDPLLKTRTRTYTPKYQPAYSFSLCPPPPFCVWL